MIQVYKKDDFSKNGQFNINPMACDLSLKINDTWELSIEVPFNVSIEKEDVICVDTPIGKRQLFRIYETAKTDDSISAQAYPIFLDSRNDLILKDVRPTDKNGQQALNIMMQNSKYKGKSNIATINTSYFVNMNLMEAINGGNDNSFLSRWGGEISYNNYTITINDKLGSDNGLRVLFGVNLSSIRETVNTSNMVTRIIPVGYNGRMLPNNETIDSPLINNYRIVYTKFIQYDDIRYEDDLDSPDEENQVYPTLNEFYEALRARAKTEFRDGIDKPEITYDVDMIDLSYTKEYGKLKNLMKVNLGDIVTVKNQRLGIETKQRVIELEYDCITKRVNKLVLGSAKNNYFDNIDSKQSSISEINQNLADLNMKFIENMRTVNLKVDGKAEITDLYVLNEKVNNLDVDSLKADYAEFKDVYLEHYRGLTAEIENINTDVLNVNQQLNALSGKIDDLDVGNLEATYAKIDLSNVTTEHVSNLFVKTGLLENATITDGHITGTLTGVKISGDLIEANTLAVKDLLLEGEDGLIYQINALASGLSQTELSKEIYQQKLNGTDIVANSITATQIAGNTITADKINVADLFAQDITATGTITGLALKGGSININDVFIVNSKGEMTARAGTLDNLTATNFTLKSGKMANFVINENGMTSTHKILNANFTTTFGGGYAISITRGKDIAELLISYDGTIECNSAKLWNINSNFVNCGNVHLANGKILFSDADRSHDLFLKYDGATFETTITNYNAILGEDKRVYTPIAITISNGLVKINNIDIVNGNIYLPNNCALWGKNTSRTNKIVTGISSSNNVYLGGSDAANATGNTNIYAGDHIYFYANRLSNSYKASGIDLFREQSGSYRTVLRPASDNGAYAGTASFRWNTVFSTNGVKTSSDIKQKDIIKDFDFKVQDFIMGLEPIAFRRTGEGNTGKRIHLGLGAQDVNKLIKDIKLGDMSLVQACIVGDEEEKPYFGEDIDDSKLVWSLNYGELIAPVILMEQNHEYRIQQLEKENMYLRQVLRDSNLLGGTI